MVDFYISAIKMDSAGQHIEFVKVHKNKTEMAHGTLPAQSALANSSAS